MTMMTLTQNERPVSSGFRVDTSRGERIGRVSSEWFSRPDDERYLSLTDLYDAVRRRADRAQVRTLESRAVKVEAIRDNAERLALLVPGRDEPVAPTHWSFGQLCGLVGAPSSYMRHHGARSQQDPSGHPSRIGGQGQETVGARRLTQTSRAGNGVPRGSSSG